MNDRLIGLTWVKACLCLLQYGCDFEINGNSARRVGSVYFTMPRPANDVSFGIRA
jgi:hypothetical protein